MDTSNTVDYSKTPKSQNLSLEVAAIGVVVGFLALGIMVVFFSLIKKFVPQLEAAECTLGLGFLLSSVLGITLYEALIIAPTLLLVKYFHVPTKHMSLLTQLPGVLFLLASIVMAITGRCLL